MFYLQHRISFDMDFFTTDEELEWHILDNEIRALSRSISAECTTITASPMFRRCELTRGAEQEILDFVIELANHLIWMSSGRSSRICGGSSRV